MGSTRSFRGFCSFSADLTTRTLLADYEQAFLVSRVWYRQMSSWSLTAIAVREAECAGQSKLPRETSTMPFGTPSLALVQPFMMWACAWHRSLCPSPRTMTTRTSSRVSNSISPCRLPQRLWRPRGSNGELCAFGTKSRFVPSEPKRVSLFPNQRQAHLTQNQIDRQSGDQKTASRSHLPCPAQCTQRVPSQDPLLSLAQSQQQPPASSHLVSSRCNGLQAWQPLLAHPPA